jgi:hypothetical protein
MRRIRGVNFLRFLRALVLSPAAWGKGLGRGMSAARFGAALTVGLERLFGVER